MQTDVKFANPKIIANIPLEIEMLSKRLSTAMHHKLYIKIY
jgi:hypothetical protein